MNLEDIKVVQERCLNIAIEFDAICKKHGIPYYMIGGTMLGAVRHGGFIPWDDDMDLGVPREYYEKLLSILKKELPHNLRLLTSLSGEVLYDSAKIEDTTTEIIEKGKEDRPSGIFIDIFPIDKTTNNKWGFFSKNWWVKHVMGINSYKKNWPKTTKEQIVAIFVRMFPNNFFLKLSYKMLSKEGEYIINYGGMWGKREIVRREFLGSPVLYPFENTCLYGVADSVKYLTCIYGNYMQLPPIDKRHNHILSFKIKE